MPKTFKPHDYQREGSSFLVGNESALLFFDPGLGKTVISLSAFATLKQLGLARRALVFAPLHVIYNVWPIEVKKWNHLSHLKTCILHDANATNRTIKFLEDDADIFLLNSENAAWLIDTKLREKIAAGKFDTLIVDEISKFKNASAKCFKALRKEADSFRFRWGLTGTPSPNSYRDLWSQVFLVDSGERLGKTQTVFNRKYCEKGGFKGKEWLLVEGSDKKIESAIQDIVLRGDAEEFLDLPDLIVNDVFVKLPPKIRKAYNDLEEDFVAELENDQEIVTDTAAGKYNLCRQVANGGYYDESGEAFDVHDAKVDAVESILNELSGKPALVAYQFRHDLDRLRKRFGAKVPVINGDTTAKQVEKIVKDWNADKLPILLAQPAAMSHGLNMQYGSGRDFIFFGLTDSLETYEQAYKRILRQGVDSTVRVHRILADKTVDLVMRDRLGVKAKRQKSFLDAMKGL